MSEPQPPTWIMVEGPDGAGKSWATRRVAHLLATNGRPCVVQKLTTTSKPKEYVFDPVEWREVHGLHVVQDRGVLSGPAYAGVRRRHNVEENGVADLIPAARTSGAVVLAVTAALDVLITRVEERGDWLIKSDELAEICENYKYEFDYWESMGGRIIRMDTTFGFPDELELSLMVSLACAQQ